MLIYIIFIWMWEFFMQYLDRNQLGTLLKLEAIYKEYSISRKKEQETEGLVDMKTSSMIRLFPLFTTHPQLKIWNYRKDLLSNETLSQKHSPKCLQYYTDTQYLLTNFILIAPLTPAHENTNIQLPPIITVAEHTFYIKFHLQYLKQNNSWGCQTDLVADGVGVVYFERVNVYR